LKAGVLLDLKGDTEKNGGKSLKKIQRRGKHLLLLGGRAASKASEGPFSEIRGGGGLGGEKGFKPKKPNPQNPKTTPKPKPPPPPHHNEAGRPGARAPKWE